MISTGKLQGIRLRHLLFWAAFLCGPVDKALGVQPQDFAASPTATTMQEGWVATGNLNVARSGHTATLLSDGTVLVAGGLPSSWGAESAELYDPTAGTWTRVGVEACAPVQNRTATLLSDGKVLVAGLLCAQVYDPATATWTRTGDMIVWRHGHTASRLADGRVLVAGGLLSNWYPDLTASAEIYDPTTGVWTLTGALAGARSGHTSTVLEDGRVLVAGGHIVIDEWGSFAYYGAEIFDPVKGRWANIKPLIFPRDAHTATLLPSGKVLLAGGQDDSGPVGSSEIFDPVTETSSVTGYLNFPREFAMAASLPNGDVLITGGGAVWGTPPSGAPHYENASGAETYDTARRRWRSAGQQITARMGHTATLLRDGRVLVAGGLPTGDSPDPLASAELYVPPPPPSIDAGFTGSWYDPEQSGHGLLVEVLPDNRFLAAWFTFNPAGTQQSWFLGVGTYSGATATINSVVQSTGGRWIPNFDPSEILNNPWGTLKFTFADCNHGRVDFASSAGYGVGSMNLTRLTQPAGLSCP